MDMLNVALPKGRLGEKVYEMFEKAGFPCPSIKENNRKLIFENQSAGVRYFWVKPSDVAIYVERGAADVGVAGKDIIAEYRPDVYELLDLKIGKCHMSVAAKADFKDDRRRTLKVATKFKNMAKEYLGYMPPVLYGGSVTALNSKDILALNSVDGVLVGGASKNPFEFSKICMSQAE